MARRPPGPPAPAGKKEPDHTPEQNAQAVIERIEQLDRTIDLQLPDDTGGLWEVATRLENEAAINMAKRGVAYLLLKQRLPHGEFVAGLAERGVVPQRAREAMAVARMLLAITDPKRRTSGVLPPASKVRSIGLLGPSKLVELAKIPVESLQDLDEQQEWSMDVDAIDAMSVRELKAKVRALNNRLEATETKRIDAEAEANEVRHNLGPYPEWVARLRMESSDFAQGALTYIDNLRRLCAEFNAPGLDPQSPDYVALVKIAAGTVALNARALQAAVSELVRDTQSIGDYGDLLEHPHQLTDEEAARVFSNWQYLLNQHELAKEEKARRRREELARKQSKPFGRPRKHPIGYQPPRKKRS